MSDVKNHVTKEAYWYPSSSAKVTTFPQSYFSGCDISIFFEDTRVSDILDFSYSLQEQMRPIYGYSSRVYDAMAVGNRIVMGGFTVAFSESKKMEERLKATDEKVKRRYPAPIVKQIQANSEALKASSSISGFKAPTLSGVNTVATGFTPGRYPIGPNASSMAGIDLSTIGNEWQTQTEYRQKVVQKAFEEIVGSKSGKYQMPTNGIITSKFGPRTSFQTDNGGQSSSYHDGIDISNTERVPVVAMAAGTVTKAEVYGTAGNAVHIVHNISGIVVETHYYHLHQIDVVKGAVVSAGQSVGLMGGKSTDNNPGNSTGRHLHFGLHVNGEKADPLTYVGNPQSSYADSAAFVTKVYKSAIVLTVGNTMAEIKKKGKTIAFKDAKPGDVYFRLKDVGVYLGNNKGAEFSATTGVSLIDFSTPGFTPLGAITFTSLDSTYSGVGPVRPKAVDYREPDLCRGYHEWNNRFEARQTEFNSLDEEVFNSSEFGYEAKESIKLRIPNLKYTKAKYVPVDKINKVVISQSKQYPVSIEELHNQMKIRGEGGVNVHFLIGKDGTTQCGMPICLSLDKDAAIHIMFEGLFDDDYYGDSSTFKPECKGPSDGQLSACVSLIKDLIDQLPALNSLYAYREYMMAYKGKALDYTTSPGVYFPMQKLEEYFSLERPTNIAHQFYNKYVMESGKEDMSFIEIQSVDTSHEEQIVSLSERLYPDKPSYLWGAANKDALWLSRKNESGFNYAKGSADSNGSRAYGLYQFNTNSGYNAFMTWLSRNTTPGYSDMYAILRNTNIASNNPGYDAIWKSVCNKYGDRFAVAQDQFVRVHYLNPGLEVAKSEAKKAGVNFPLSVNNIGYTSAIFSTVVQFGPGSSSRGTGLAGICKGTFQMLNGAPITELTFLEAFHKVKERFFRSSKGESAKTIETLVRTRCVQELAEIKQLLANGGTTVYPTANSIPLDPGTLDDGIGTGTWTNNGWTSTAATYYNLGKVTKPVAYKSTSDNMKLLQEMLNSAGANPTLYVDRNYGAKTLAALKTFLNKNKITGALDANNNITVAGWDKIAKAATKVVKTPGTQGNKPSSSDADAKYNETKGKTSAELTTDIWGIDQIEVKKDETQAYFYNDATPHLQLSGFDIVIQYGYEYDGTTYKKQTKKIKNVQLRSVGQSIAPTGEVIGERYEFIARDIE